MDIKNNLDGGKKKKDLNESDKARLKMVERINPRFGTMDQDKLYDALRKRYGNDGTLAVICYSLKKYFDIIDKENKADYFGKKGAELSMSVNNQEAKNELTGNEIKNWKTQDQILKIMNHIDLITQTDKNRFLLLAMTTMQPPLRKAFYQSVQFLFNLKEDNKKDNYIFLQPPNKGKSFYIVNTDKVSKYEKFNTPENKIIEINNPALIQLLMRSYLEYPRKYVFQMDDDQPYTMNSISKVLLENPFKLNFNILRSSYITNFFNIPDNNFMQARIDLSKKMRHSVDKQQLNYFKRNNGNMKDNKK